MHQRPSLTGKIKAVVVDIDDPLQRGRIRVQAPELFSDPETNEVVPSAWIEGSGASGGGSGAFSIPQVGSPVWVENQYTSGGELWQLIWSPGRFGSNDVPATAKGVDDNSSGALKASSTYRVLDSTGTLTTVQSTPQGFMDAKYADSRVLKTPGGLVFELDDTPGAARFHLFHPTGSFIEMSDAGVLVERATKVIRETRSGTKHFTGGNKTTSIQGDRLGVVEGNWLEQVGGGVSLKTFSTNLESSGPTNIQSSGNMTFDSNGSTTITATHHVELAAGGNVATVAGGNIHASATGNYEVLGIKGVRLVSAVGISLNSTTGTVVAPPGTDALAVPVARSTSLISVIGSLNVLVAQLALAFTSLAELQPAILPQAAAIEALSISLTAALADAPSLNLRCV